MLSNKLTSSLRYLCIEMFLFISLAPLIFFVFTIPYNYLNIEVKVYASERKITWLLILIYVFEICFDSR